jgi:hypothetical protein
MLGRILEVALFAFIAICLLAPLLRGATRRVWAARTRGPGTTPAEPSAALDADRASAFRGQQPPEAAGAGKGRRSAAEGDEIRRRWAGWIGGTLFAIAIMNFLAYSVHTGELGGSADKRVEGQYYVSSHGRYTEVTEQQWRAVRAHGMTVFVTHALGLLVGGTLLAYSQHWWGKQKQAEPLVPPDPRRQ